MQLRALKGSEYSNLYQLMQEEDFPDTPDHFYEAKSFFESCLCYGKFSEEGLLEAAFIFGDLTNENAFVDVVCQKSLRGRWATKKTLKWVINTAFKYLSLDYLWINPRKEESLMLAIKLGFKHVHELGDTSVFTMVLTKQNVSTKYYN